MNCVQGNMLVAVTCVFQGLGLLLELWFTKCFIKTDLIGQAWKGNQGERLTCLESLKSRLTSVTGGAKAQMLCPQKLKGF